MVRKQWDYFCHVLICMVKTIVHSLHFTLIDSKMVAISFFLSLSQLALLIIQENFVPDAKYQLWKFGHVENSLLLLLFFYCSFTTGFISVGEGFGKTFRIAVLDGI